MKRIEVSTYKDGKPGTREVLVDYKVRKTRTPLKLQTPSDLKTGEKPTATAISDSIFKKR